MKGTLESQYVRSNILRTIINPNHIFHAVHSTATLPIGARRLARTFVSTFCIGGALLTGAVAHAANPLFTDVTTAVGITHVNNSDASFDTGGGFAWIDIDNDGFQDLYVPNNVSGEASWLYHNVDDGNGSRKFVEIAGAFGGDAQNVTARGSGVAVGDYDGDGCDDLFIANGFGFAGTTGPASSVAEVNTLLRNNFCDNGSFTFSDVTTAAGLDGEIANSMVASFGDLDNDGDLDLYVGNYIPNNGFQNSLCEPNHLYINNGNGTFTEMGRQLTADDEGCALASTMTDFDGDGDLDIYVVNDFSSQAGGAFIDRQDAFYRNMGVDGTGALLPFVKVPEANVADAANGMGIGVGDYDNDGDLDYYASSFSKVGGENKQNVLNQNNGDGTFVEVADFAGVADRFNEFNPGLPIISWGAVFADFDSDGYTDLYKVNGRVQDSFALVLWDVQPNRLHMNNQDGTFTEMGASAGVDGEVPIGHCSVFAPLACFDQSRGVAVADYDNDGDVDLFVVNLASFFAGAQAPRLYRNDTVTSNNTIQLRLEGTNSNRRGIGAKVRVTTNPSGGPITQLQEVSSGTSHGSTNSFALHFGLGSETSASQVIVDWPSGCQQVINDVPAGIHKIHENCTGTFQVGGRITHNGEGLDDVHLFDFFTFAQATTDREGFYVLTGYNANGSAGYFPFTPGAPNPWTGKQGFQFSPANIVVSLSGSDSLGHTFTGTLIDGSVSGRFTSPLGAPVANLQVIDVMTEFGQGGPGSATAISDANGFYVIPSTLSIFVLLNATGNVGYDITPPSEFFTKLPGPNVDHNFIAELQ